MPKYIFVTGGVVSSLGKGLTAATIGLLLENRGLTVTLQKFDPYINVDPGTMNPYEHGEVYVTDDGAETDLDLGHYERFTSAKLTQLNNSTSGQVYERVIQLEREGKWLGKTVQVIPHVTDEIKRRVYAVGDDVDVVITEIGGTVGDIEGLPFLEAIRQFRLDVGHGNAINIHLTYVPYIKAADEIKTKPTQHSVTKLREIGIQPDILICRTERHLDADVRGKIALFCNVSPDAVIEEIDVETTIYELPLMLRAEGVDRRIINLLDLKCDGGDLGTWERIVQTVKEPEHTVRVAVVGKYIDRQDAYKSVYEAIAHAGIYNKARVEVKKIDPAKIEKSGAAAQLKGVDGILVPGGFGKRGIEGKIAAARYAREKGIPYLGLCLGMQCATIEFARDVMKLKDANSTEFHPETPHPVISLLDEQRKVVNMGGTMRLGAYPCLLKSGTKTYKAYKTNEIAERHRHRYEMNPGYRAAFETAGMIISGSSPDGALTEIIELRDHPWFVACQFHPEFRSKPTLAHPLFRDFVAAAIEARYAAGA
ncbi:MAG: CTP synthase [Verrucomicrobia bacterium]|nr:CTP synthase [Verrucomicrobiota bacterium]